MVSGVISYLVHDKVPSVAGSCLIGSVIGSLIKEMLPCVANDVWLAKCLVDRLICYLVKDIVSSVADGVWRVVMYVRNRH